MRDDSLCVNLFLGASFALGFCIFAICSGVCNSHGRFPPCFVNGPQVLFPSKGKIAVQSHTAITSIVGYRRIHTIPQIPRQILRFRRISHAKIQNPPAILQFRRISRKMQIRQSDSATSLAFAIKKAQNLPKKSFFLQNLPFVEK